MKPMHKVWEAAWARRETIVAWRRHLHRAPELSFEEQGTCAYVQAALDAMGVPWERVGPYGVVATVQGRHADRMVALRADMDALPIQEANDHLAYCSAVPGVMHACGHDGHVAMLLGAAAVLQSLRGDLHGSVKLCFQQAEERGGGTAEMLEHLARFPVRSAFAIHLWSEMESGTICTRSGPRMAACDNFEIVFDGVGCHGAAPHRGVDPLVAASALVQNAATLVAREIDPAHAAALTFGKLHSGHAGNVIPHQASLAGSIRTTDLADQAHLRAALQRIVDGTAETYRVQAHLQIRRGGGALINDAGASALATQCVKALFGDASSADFPPLMVSENFGDFLDHYPGLMALVGARNPQVGACYPHHHPRFNIDEEALPRGAALYAQYAMHWLEVHGQG